MWGGYVNGKGVREQLRRVDDHKAKETIEWVEEQAPWKVGVGAEDRDSVSRKYVPEAMGKEKSPSEVDLEAFLFFSNWL